MIINKNSQLNFILFILIRIFIIGFLIGVFFIYNKSLIPKESKEYQKPKESITSFEKLEKKTLQINIITGAPVELKPIEIIPLTNCEDAPAISYAGDYWLIGCGSKVYKYQDNQLTLITSFAENFRINVIKWNGFNFLIGGWDRRVEQPPGFLYSYDGINFKEISRELTGSVGEISWNGSYWLIGTGKGMFRSPTGVHILPWSDYPVGLYKYDGENLQNLTPEIEKYGFKGGVITISNNGSYWLIGGTRTELTITGYTQEEIAIKYDKPILLKYDGDTFQDLSLELLNFGYFVSDIEWNGDYFLIGGISPEEAPCLNKFDGKKFTDLSKNFPLDYFEMIHNIHWNGYYWLIEDYSCGYGFCPDNPVALKLLAFDGEKFSRQGNINEEIVGALGGDSGENYYLQGGFGRESYVILFKIPFDNELVNLKFSEPEKIIEETADLKTHLVEDTSGNKQKSISKQFIFSPREECKVNFLKFIIFWENEESELDLTILGPDKEEWNAEYINPSLPIKTVTIYNPQPGAYQTKTYGKKVATNKEEKYTIQIFQPGTLMQVKQDKWTLNFPSESIIVFEVKEEAEMCDLLNVTFKVSDLKQIGGKEIIPGSSFTFIPNHFNVEAGNSREVIAIFHPSKIVPVGEYSGILEISSNNPYQEKITREIKIIIK